MLQQLESLGIEIKKQKKRTCYRWKSNRTNIFIYRNLAHLKRSEAEEMVEENGGKLLGGVSSKLNYLVVGEDAGSKLEKAKKINSIKIISEAEFLKMLN